MVPNLIAGQNLVVPTSEIDISINVETGFFNLYALRLNSSGCIGSPNDVVFFWNETCSDGSVQHQESFNLSEVADGIEMQAQLTIALDQQPSEVQKVAIALSSLSNSVSDLGDLSLLATVSSYASSQSSPLFRARIPTSGRDECALILGEFYRYKEQWKFRFVAQGFTDSFLSLLAQYDPRGLVPFSEGEALDIIREFQRRVSDLSDEKKLELNQLVAVTAVGRFRDIATPPARRLFDLALASFMKDLVESDDDDANHGTGAANAPRVNLKKVSLTKSQPKVNLGKVQHIDRGDGIYRVNLNWSRTPAKQSSSMWSRLFSGHRAAIDLDLGAYVRFINGAQTIVQALGDKFGHFHTPPFVELQGDDRTGDQADGEWLYINSQHIELISEIVIFALIYGGVTKWSDTDAVVTVDIAGQPKVETRLYETSGVDNSLRVCAIARIRIDDDNISIERIEDYFIDHSYMDRYFGWGFKWKPGRK